VCTRVLEINASHSKSLFRRGNSYSAIGNNDAALDDMCQIIRFDPDNVEASDAIAKLMTQSHTQEQDATQVNGTNKKTDKHSSAPTKQATQEKAKPKKAEQLSQKKNAGIVPVPETAPIVSPIEPPSPPASPAAVPVNATQSPVDVSKKVAEFKTIGNAHFKAGKLEDAITAYTDALSLGELNGASISILSNRAMAHLKVNKPAACVEDCTTALDLLLAAKQDDVQVPVMVKLLYRRASANKTLNALPAAIVDLEQAHALEPHNKAVRTLLQQLRDAKATSTDPNPTTAGQGQANGTATSSKRAPLVQEVVPDVERQQQIALERQKAKMRAETQSENAQKAKDIAARARVRQRDDAALPGVPKSVHEFQSSWRLFNGNQQRRGEYLFQIPLPHLCKLLRVEVNDDLLVEIANALVALGSDGEALAARQADWALGLLRALSKLSRFSTAVMFLSGSATKLFAQVFEVIYDKLGTNQEMKDTVHEVRSKYCKQ
jgi:tetratricopeptide (TPR) repeat protein